LKIYENKVLKRLFGPKKNEMIEGWQNCVRKRSVIRYN
jgi:hypothetical protein